MCYSELSNELVFLKDIQHTIDLISWSPLPNLPHYRMNPMNLYWTYRIRKKSGYDSEESINKESMNPCTVLDLHTLKKNGVGECVDNQGINTITINDIIDVIIQVMIYAKINQKTICEVLITRQKWVEMSEKLL